MHLFRESSGMLSFKELIAEAGDFPRGDDNRRHIRYNNQKSVPHIPLLDYYEKDGKTIKLKNDDERLETLLSYDPVRSDSERNVQMHDLLNKMENSDKPITCRSHDKQPVQYFQPIHAQIGRMLNNGGTMTDVHNFLNSRYDHLDDERFIQRNTAQRYVDQLKNAINNFQSLLPEKERLAFSGLAYNSQKSTLPGSLAVKSFLTHPDHRDDLHSLSTSEFYDKHLARHMGPMWAEMSRDERQYIGIRFAQARKITGMSVTPEQKRARQARGYERRQRRESIT